MEAYKKLDSRIFRQMNGLFSWSKRSPCLPEQPLCGRLFLFPCTAFIASVLCSQHLVKRGIKSSRTADGTGQNTSPRLLCNKQPDYQ